MRTGLDILRHLVALGDEAQTMPLEQWLTLVVRLIAEANEYVDVVDGKQQGVLQ